MQCGNVSLFIVSPASSIINSTQLGWSQTRDLCLSKGTSLAPPPIGVADGSYMQSPYWLCVRDFARRLLPLVGYHIHLWADNSTCISIDCGVFVFDQTKFNEHLYRARWDVNNAALSFMALCVRQGERFLFIGCFLFFF